MSEPVENEFSEIKNKIIQVLSGVSQFILVFGSFAKNTQTSKSDIDVACYFKQEQSEEKIFDYKVKLEDLIERNVDLICLNHADIIITMQILANGNLIFTDNLSFFNIYKAQKIGEYIDFKQSRKVIEDNLARRGSHRA